MTGVWVVVVTGTGGRGGDLVTVSRRESDWRGDRPRPDGTSARGATQRRVRRLCAAASPRIGTMRRARRDGAWGAAPGGSPTRPGARGIAASQPASAWFAGSRQSEPIRFSR